MEKPLLINSSLKTLRIPGKISPGSQPPVFPLFSRERNKIYVEICNAKIDSEYFEEKMVQTISGAAKTKEVQCETITTAEKGKPGQDTEKRDFLLPSLSRRCFLNFHFQSFKFRQDSVVFGGRFCPS